jgi:hypothetical protein
MYALYVHLYVSILSTNFQRNPVYKHSDFRQQYCHHMKLFFYFVFQSYNALSLRQPRSIHDGKISDIFSALFMTNERKILSSTFSTFIFFIHFSSTRSHEKVARVIEK